MKSAAKTSVIVVILACLAGLLIWAFLENKGERVKEKEGEEPVKPPMRVVSTERGSIVVLDRGTLTMSGIRLQPLRETSRYGEVTAYGSVVDIQEMLDWLSDYERGDGELEKSRAELEVSQNEYLRLKGLHDNNHNVSDKALQASEGAWRADKAQVRVGEASLRNLQSTALQRWGGVIARWLVGRSPEIDRLVRQEDALVLITLPSAIPLHAPPRSIRIEGAAATQTEALLVSPSPRMTPNIQGFSCYYLASAAKKRLLPGMNVVASLPVGEKVKGVCIPASAVVWWEGKAWIYLQRMEGRFERTEIATEHPAADGCFVSKDLTHADTVVVAGAQLLLSEELRSQIRIVE